MSPVLGVGIDLVELERIARLHERYGAAFASRFCRPGEWQERRGPALVQHLGGVFAAKEAVLKALGSGWAQGLGLRQVEIVRRGKGPPRVELHGEAARRAQAMGVERVHVSISHEGKMAAAVAILEGAERPPGAAPARGPEGGGG